jgi:hypothetical protein
MIAVRETAMDREIDAIMLALDDCLAQLDRENDRLMRKITETRKGD